MTLSLVPQRGWPQQFARASFAPHALALTLVLLQTACGGGSSDTSMQTAATRSVRASAVNERVGPNCASGGARIDAGIDANNNGLLDAAEITSTQYVCNGATGATGASGANGATGATGATGAAGATGATGQSGLSMLMRMDSEAAGANCPTGGTRIAAGFDTNNNGVLDTAEFSGPPSYVCGGLPGAAGTNGTNGAPGATGASGPAGATGAAGPAGPAGVAGTAGAAGTNGANGLSSLMVMTTEVAGANCTYGGTKVTAGLDSNGNGVLDAGEVTATSYNCNGAPGAGITWIDVAGTSQQAVSGIGYLADNAAQVTITLPTAPTIGDLIEVSGAGAGGWKIAQNGSQSIVTKGIPAIYANYGATWTPQAAAGSRNWVSITSSADGSKLAALDYSGYIYTSADSGVSWTARNNPRTWRSITSSADGNKVVAVADSDQIYTSTDAGVSWTARDSTRNWAAVASSANGNKLLAAVYGAGQLYTSTDSGVSWTARNSNRDWSAVASSADGSKLVATVANGQIYTSTDSGVTWTARQSGRHWDSVASSADGSKLVATAFYDNIWTSTDSGVNWTARAGFAVWSSVASSSDGTRLVAVDNQPGYIYTSTDSGVTWTPRESVRSWVAVAASSDCSKLAAVVANGPLYTSASPTDRTTPGTGFLTGSQYDAIALQYLGNGLFLPLSASSYSGTFIVY